MSTLSGYTPLRAMLQKAIREGEEKIASAEGRSPAPVEQTTKTASAQTETGIDFHNPEHMDKLASALEKLADAPFTGGEVKGGGELMATGAPVGGKQSYKKDPAASLNPPMRPGTEKTTDAPGTPSTLLATNQGKAPAAGKAMPKKGVLKTAGQQLLEKLQPKTAGEAISSKMSKVAYGEVEKRMGGETLDSAAGQGVPATPAGGGNVGRKHIQSNTGPAALNKREAKSPVKKDLSQVLTEPALSAAKDSKVQDNLRNASKGGVKIAAVAKALVEKIAAEGCTCGGKGECRNCKMKAKLEEMKG